MTTRIPRPPTFPGQQEQTNKDISRGKRKKQWISSWKEAQINSLINERDKVSKLLKINNNGKNRKRLTKISESMEEGIAECKKIKWADFCSPLDPRKDVKH
ncbi:hypothetical protein TNIN_479481 [Trichonephila inaurata madagascariensis]|uniref:Uncharacterized protein n=1 Tax=Trichonephila inaurata madagascariensis TaxID=2747483 RepID=A0A8X7CED6_9ARAC|nr:hypothetical protein TNIN_479481 [Trichonephila inaurata madagascariensis]